MYSTVNVIFFFDVLFIDTLVFDLLLLTHFECFSMIVKNEIGVVYDAVSFAMMFDLVKKLFNNESCNYVNLNESKRYVFV